MGLSSRATERYISYRNTCIAGRVRPPTGVTVITRKPTAEGSARHRTGSPLSAGQPRVTTGALGSAMQVPGTPRKKAAVAGPTATRTREPDPRVDQFLEIITTSLEDDKAEDIVVIDLTGRASFADRMVIATGLADRQIAAMAAHIDRKLGEAGLKRIRTEGAGGSDWVLLDAGDIVVHLFKAEARALYGLERMWGADLDVPPDAPATPVE